MFDMQNSNRHDEISAKTEMWLRWVQKAIREEPERLDMSVLGYFSTKYVSFIDDEGKERGEPRHTYITPDEMRDCGTPRCIMGTMMMLYGNGRNINTGLLHDAVGMDTDMLVNHLELENDVFLKLCMMSISTPCIEEMRITAEEACEAIENVIMHNDPRWGDVIGDRYNP